jgi:hypothetical protein
MTSKSVADYGALVQKISDIRDTQDADYEEVLRGDQKRQDETLAYFAKTQPAANDVQKLRDLDKAIAELQFQRDRVQDMMLADYRGNGAYGMGYTLNQESIMKLQQEQDKADSALKPLFEQAALLERLPEIQLRKEFNRDVGDAVTTRNPFTATVAYLIIRARRIPKPPGRLGLLASPSVVAEMQVRFPEALTWLRAEQSRASGPPGGMRTAGHQMMRDRNGGAGIIGFNTVPYVKEREGDGSCRDLGYRPAHNWRGHKVCMGCPPGFHDEYTLRGRRCYPNSS